MSLKNFEMSFKQSGTSIFRMFNTFNLQMFDISCNLPLVSNAVMWTLFTYIFDTILFGIHKRCVASKVSFHSHTLCKLNKPHVK